MTPRDEYSGVIRIGHSLRGSGGGGIPFTLDLGSGQSPERGLRPQDDVGRGPSGEYGILFARTFQIQILAGRSGSKYSWKRVHPLASEGGIGYDSTGGGTYDGFFAKEMGGDTSVPEGAIVQAYPSDLGPWLLFGGGKAGFVFVKITDAGSTVGSPSDFLYSGVITRYDTATAAWVDDATAIYVKPHTGLLSNGSRYEAQGDGTMASRSLYVTVGDATEVSGSGRAGLVGNGAQTWNGEKKFRDLSTWQDDNGVACTVSIGTDSTTGASSISIFAGTSTTTARILMTGHSLIVMGGLSAGFTTNHAYTGGAADLAFYYSWFNTGLWIANDLCVNSLSAHDGSGGVMPGYNGSIDLTTAATIEVTNGVITGIT